MAQQGIIGLFSEPEQVKAGAVALRQAKYDGMDAFTPYPVHGLGDALGLKRSWVSAVTLLFGLLGCLGGLVFTIWTSAYDWPINIGGKPMVSIPAFIPIVFECTVLLGGVMTFFAVWWFSGLPNYGRKLVDPRVTKDAFALWIPLQHEGQRGEVERMLKEHGAYEVRVA